MLPVRLPGVSMIRATLTERRMMQDEMLEPSVQFRMWTEEDVIALEVAGIVTEHPSVSEALRFLAEIAEDV